MQENQVFGELRSAVAEKMWIKNPYGFYQILETCWYCMEEGYHVYLKAIIDTIPDEYRVLTPEMVTPDMICSVAEGRSKIPYLLVYYVKHVDLGKFTFVEMKECAEAIQYLDSMMKFGFNLVNTKGRKPTRDICEDGIELDSYGNYNWDVENVIETNITMMTLPHWWTSAPGRNLHYRTTFFSDTDTIWKFVSLRKLEHFYMPFHFLEANQPARIQDRDDFGDYYYYFEDRFGFSQIPTRKWENNVISNCHFHFHLIETFKNFEFRGVPLRDEFYYGELIEAVTILYNYLNSRQDSSATIYFKYSHSKGRKENNQGFQDYKTPKEWIDTFERTMGTNRQILSGRSLMEFVIEEVKVT